MQPSSERPPGRQVTLTKEEIKSLQATCYRRLDRGIAGHLALRISDIGGAYAEILNEPEGETVFKIWRIEQAYVLFYCSPLYGPHVIAESPSFTGILAALPQWPPATSEMAAIFVD